MLRFAQYLIFQDDLPYSVGNLIEFSICLLNVKYLAYPPCKNLRIAADMSCKPETFDV